MQGGCIGGGGGCLRLGSHMNLLMPEPFPCASWAKFGVNSLWLGSCSIKEDGLSNEICRGWEVALFQYLLHLHAFWVEEQVEEQHPMFVF